MKPIHFTLALLVLLPFLLPAQTVSINEFYRKYKNSGEENTHLTLPGWVVRLGVGIAKTQVEDNTEKDALKLAKKIGKMRVLTFEESNPVTDKDRERLLKGVRRENFEDLIMVREEGTHVHIMMREKKDRIKNLLILVNEEDTFTMVSLKARLHYDDLNDFLQTVMDEEAGGVQVKL
jgi:type IV secretory pathway ATPase VirB11/archaellum biosynthesis ATPase